MISSENISNEIFKILKGSGQTVRLFTDEGENTVDPSTARRFYMPKLGSMVNLEETESTREIKVSVNQNTELDNFKDTLYQLKNLANRSVIEYTLKNFTKAITPKDQDYQAQKVRDMKIDEGISPAYGTSKSSYQQLESAKLIIKHTKPVNEESRGSRSRNINAIYIENADGERYKMPTNNLAGGRAMLRHVKEGGIPHDDFGKHIQEQTIELKKLKEFANYSRRNNLVNEDTADIVEAVSQRISSIRETINKLKGIKAYNEAKEKFEAKEPVNEGFESDEVMAIMAKHPEDVAKMKQTGDLDAGSELYMDLMDYYSDEMPYGTMKARDGDPVEYIMDKLDDLDMLESSQNKLRNQFTVRTFDEGLNDALPYVNALVKEMKAIKEADEFATQTLNDLVSTIDKMDSVRLRKGVNVKSDPENPLINKKLAGSPMQTQLGAVASYLSGAIDGGKDQDQLSVLLARFDDVVDKIKDGAMLKKAVSAIKTLMPKLTTKASEATGVNSEDYEQTFENAFAKYNFDKLFG